MSRPSRRAEQDVLRERMRAAGMSHDEIAIEFARRYRLRPRIAHRLAQGWTQQQAVYRINAHAARTGLDPGGAATMTAPWLSELETWPLPPRRRPTPQMLALLAEVYGCDLHSLLDLDDREHMPPTDKLLIDSMRRTDQRGTVRTPGPTASDVRTALAGFAQQPDARSLGVVQPDTEERWHRPDLPIDASLGAGGGIIDDVDRAGRRTFSILAGSTIVAGAVGAGRAGAVDPALADYFSGQLDGHLPIDRRGFVTATAATITFGQRTPRPVDPALTDYFDQQLEGHYRADMMLGPHGLLKVVTAQYSLLDGLVRAGREETRLGLLRSAAVYAALIGWLYQDAGDLPAASVWRGVALEVAQRSQDPHLVAYALINHASVRTDLGDGAGVLDLCEAVLANSGRLTPKLRLMALQQQAHGASLLGDRATVDAVLDQAALFADRYDDGLPWGNACGRTPGYLEIQRATCYGRLGLGRAAMTLWDQILTATPTRANRDHGVYLSRYAVASAQAGEPQRALALARAGVDLAVETGSVRIRGELAGLRRQMRPWGDTPLGRDLDEILMPLKETRHG